MMIDTATYPIITIPFRLRILFLKNDIVRFATFNTTEDSNSTKALEQEFNALIRRENATISRICFSYAGSVSEFDDLRQDALINIWRGLKSFRGEASGKTWIYRVTINSCLSAIRSQSRHQHESLDGLYNMIATDESDRSDIEQIHGIISRLGVQEKAIIMMWLDEMSYDEIASAMDMNRNTVATKIRRIKEKISKEFES